MNFGLIEQIVVLLVAVIGAFVAGSGLKWKTKQKARKEVLDKIEDERVDEYIKTKERLNARDRVTDVDDARERLRKRKQSR